MCQNTYNLLSFLLTLVQIGILIFTARWAKRYTLETIELRKSAEEQAEATAKQLAIAQASFEDLKEERIKASYPFLWMTAEITMPGVCELTIDNKNAAIYDAVIECTEGISNEHDPVQGYLERDKPVVTKLSGPVPWPEQWGFCVKYATLLHQKTQSNYSVTACTKIKHIGYS